jgi:prolipoprotein diacylglyceryl transferase
MQHVGALPLFIPSPPINAFHIGPLEIHFYALGYIVGIFFAMWITRARWRAAGGDPDLVNDIALWVVPAGIIGGRIYFDITTPNDIPHVWYGAFAVWSGGLGIWGGVLVATLVGVWRLRKMGVTAGAFANAVAPGLLVAQGIGRIGNYFNKELFGNPTTLPWGLEIPLQYRVAGGIPTKDLSAATFQPTFLYELIWDLLLALFLVWLARRVHIKSWALFALYVAGYSGFRIFEESVRVDSSEHFLGLRLNFFVAIFGTVAGLVWFYFCQRATEKPVVYASPKAANAVDEVPSATGEAQEAQEAQGSEESESAAVADNAVTDAALPGGGGAEAGGVSPARSEE